MTMTGVQVGADLAQPVQARQSGVNDIPNANPKQPNAGVLSAVTPGAPAGMQSAQSALAAQIAKAISIGLVQAPNSPAEWAKLADFYSTTAGENQIKAAELQTPTQTAGTVVTQGAQGTTATSPQGLNAFLGAIRKHESGGNYAANSGDGAYGAYQFIPSTWASEAKAAGQGQWAGVTPDKAPPAVQDAVAAHMAQGYFQQYGNWGSAAGAWYSPANVNQNVVPHPEAGNKQTVLDYQNQILQMMGQQPNVDAGHPSAGSPDIITKIATAQIGTPYVWGGEDPSNPGHPGAFDCSGLVQWTYGQAGVKLPRVAQAQYDATSKVAGPLQPGDLLFFGSGPKGIEHVGIYIGNNQMIDAPHTGADVRIDPNPTQWGNYVGATRPGDPGGATTAATSAANPLQAMQNYQKIYQQVTQQLQALYQQYPGSIPKEANGNQS